MLKKFIITSRYDKPYGIFFLYYPCLWGICLTNTSITDVLFICIIFFLGACGMRAAGCIWNDINDKEFDKKVKRTAKRPIAMGVVGKKEILLYITINLLIGTTPLYFISIKSILLCICVIPLIISYPFMKRFTWWPQMWLGLNYNWGLIVGFSVFNENIFSSELVFFYLGCLLWTVAYDTVYGFQDIKDDKKIGIKSTSIKFQEIAKPFIIINYILSFIFWVISLTIIGKPLLLIFLILLLFLLIILKLFFINLKNPNQCYKFFAHNCFFGFLVTMALSVV